MLRCSRLIVDNDVERLKLFIGGEFSDASIRETAINALSASVQPGDRMTGWERVASEPLEAQRNFWDSEVLTSEVGKRCEDIDDYTDALIDALSALYEYDGKQWMEVKTGREGGE